MQQARKPYCTKVADPCSNLNFSALLLVHELTRISFPERRVKITGFSEISANIIFYRNFNKFGIL